MRAQAADGAQIVAASASGRLDQPAELDALVATVDRELGARVIIVDAHGRAARRLGQRPGTRGVAYGSGPEIAAALAGRTVQGTGARDTLGENLLYTAVPVVDAGRTVGAVRVTQSVTAVDRQIRRDQLALVGVGAARAALRAARDVVRRRLAVAARCAASPARRAASAAATLKLELR